MNLNKSYRKHSKKFERSTTGCLTCRKSKRKCDNKKPTCGRCSKLELLCEQPKTRFFQFKAQAAAINSGTQKSFVEIETSEGDVLLPRVQENKIATLNHAMETAAFNLSVSSSHDRVKSRFDINYLSTIPESYVRKLISPSQDMLADYQRRLNEIFDGALTSPNLKSPITIDRKIGGLPDTLANPVGEKSILPNEKTNIFKGLVNKEFVEEVLKVQELIPRELLENFYKTSNATENALILNLLNLWCCLYCYYCSPDIEDNFQALVDDLFKVIMKDFTRDFLSYKSIELKLIIMVLLYECEILNIKGSQSSSENPSNRLFRIKALINENGGIIKISEESELTNYIIRYLFYIDLATGYAPFSGTVFTTVDVNKFFSKGRSPIIQDLSSPLEILHILMRFYYEISRLSSLVNVADDDIDLNAILLEANHIEKQLIELKLDLSLVKNPSEKQEKAQLFEFYKNAAHLYLLQCVYRRQSLSIETMLIARKILNQVYLMVQSRYSRQFCLLPLFILSVDVATFETRSWILHQFDHFYELTRSPVAKHLIRLLREVWLVNVDGYKYVFWPEIISQHCWSIFFF